VKDYHLIECSEDRHSSAILSIFNDAIVNTTSLYDLEERTAADMEQWFAAKVKGHFPVIGYENTAGELMAFATYGQFRNYDGFQYTVEHSLYVDRRFQGNGLGEKIMIDLIDNIQEHNYHAMIAGIDSENKASIALHEKMGFVRCGSLKEAAFKFDRWLDLEFYQKIL
jgi:L-amino acid N-acyltransferase YncA